MADASSTRSLLLAAAAGAALATACTALWLVRRVREDGDTALRRARLSRTSARGAGPAGMHAAAGCGDGVLGAVGNTPLVRIASLSEATGCEARVQLPFSCCALTCAVP